MANVIIREKDLTSNQSYQATDVAYVPGLSSKRKLGDKPVYCDSIDKFKNAFGADAVRFTEDYSFDVWYGPDNQKKSKEIQFKAGDVDTGYIYAMEILSAGMPVLYEAVNKDTTTFTAKDMYDAMVGVKAEEEVEDSEPTGTVDVEEETGEKYLAFSFTAGEDAVGFKGIKSFTVTTVDGAGETVAYNNCTIDEKYYTVVAEPDENNRKVTNYKIKFTEDAIVRGDSENPNFIMLVKGILDRTIEETEIEVVYTYVKSIASEQTESIFVKLADRGTFNIKYMTSGGYPTFEYGIAEDGQGSLGSISGIMINACAAQMGGGYGNNPVTGNTTDDSLDPAFNGRGDCVALIDHFNIPERPLQSSNPHSVHNCAQNAFTDDYKNSYAAMFTPFAQYALSNGYGIDADGNTVSSASLPASFAYIRNLARSIQTFDNFQAIAGISRGAVANIKYDSITDEYAMETDAILTNYIANSYNNNIASTTPFVSINPITRINPYGEVIWGNRTLIKSGAEGVKAIGFLNMRNMLSDIKKKIYTASRELMFEQNSDVLWVEFRSKVEPLLEQLKYGNGIKDYTLFRMRGTGKTVLQVGLQIVPVYALETIDVTINVTDEGVELSESAYEA